MKCNVMQYDAMWCCVMWCDIKWCDETWRNACDAIHLPSVVIVRYVTIRYFSIRYVTGRMLHCLMFFFMEQPRKSEDYHYRVITEWSSKKSDSSKIKVKVGDILQVKYTFNILLESVIDVILFYFHEQMQYYKNTPKQIPRHRWHVREFFNNLGILWESFGLLIPHQCLTISLIHYSP